METSLTTCPVLKRIHCTQRGADGLETCRTQVVSTDAAACQLRHPQRLHTRQATTLRLP